MHLRIRFIGKALEYLEANGHDDRRLTVQVNPELMHVGDLVRHPLFPGRNVYVVAREVDLIDRCVTVWLDELSGSNRGARDHDGYAGSDVEIADSPFPVTPSSIGD
ncbi:MAG: hypothetical protein ACXWCY_16440 [Burkholderiales bacterium]